MLNALVLGVVLVVAQTDDVLIPQAPQAEVLPEDPATGELEISPDRPEDEEEPEETPRRRTNKKERDPRMSAGITFVVVAAAIFLVSLVAGFLPLVSYIPFLAAGLAALAGGAAAWALNGYINKRRVPLGKVMWATLATELAVLVPLTLVAAVVAVMTAMGVGLTAVFGGLALESVLGASGSGLGFVALYAGLYGALYAGLFAFSSLTGLASAGACLSAAGVASWVSFKDGRRLEPDEDELNMDMWTVPAAGEPYADEPVEQ